MSLGERIFKYRKKASISQEELADKLNVTRQSISLWETDQTLPSLDNLIALADIFDISLDELCGRNLHIPETSNTANKPQDADTQTQKYSRTYQTLLTIAFALSIASVFAALIIAFILLQTATFPQYTILITQYMWICFIFLPIPIASIVLGEIFIGKKYKCKKNVIAGCIVCAALIAFGSFTPIYKNNIGMQRDSELFVDTINMMTPMTIPANSCKAVFSTPKLTEYYGTVMSGMIEFSSKEDYLQGLNNINMLPSIENTPFPKGFLNLQDRFIIRNCHHFYIYNVNTEEENVITTQGGLFVFIAFEGYTGYVKILRI